jgi:ABC-type transport system substrate-binding protein
VADSGRRDLPGGVQKLIVTVLAATLLAACSSGKAAAPEPTNSPSPSATVSVEDQVLAAWRAEHLAYADALKALNPNDPTLAQTAINPALQRAVAFIAAAKAQGIVIRGSQDLGAPTVVSLNPTTAPDTAVVRACIHDGLVLINGKTGKPVPGTAGQVTFAMELTTLKLVEGVGWMVSDNDIKQGLKESVCSAS